MEWHEWKTGVYNPQEKSARGAGGRGVVAGKLVVGWQGDPVEFGRRLHWEALRGGLGRARARLMVGDGAAWIWNVAQDRWKGSTVFFGLDSFGLAQYVCLHGVCFPNVCCLGRESHNLWLGNPHHGSQPTFTPESRHRFHFHRQPYCLGDKARIVFMSIRVRDYMKRPLDDDDERDSSPESKAEEFAQRVFYEFQASKR